MAPKKEEKPPERPPLGRHSNNVAAGIVGMPNVGKSTTFNTMCQMSVPAENFPFCTIDPSESRVQLDDERFRKLIEHFKPKSEVPAFLKIFDIAGLVKGAADGAGLGNAFLSHIAATDAILNVCRTFEETVDGEVATHVEDSVDPVRDLEIISEELRMKDVAHILKTIEPIRKEVRWRCRLRSRAFRRARAWPDARRAPRSLPK
jgi:obg-like ATPase 1